MRKRVIIIEVQIGPKSKVETATRLMVALIRLKIADCTGPIISERVLQHRMGELHSATASPFMVLACQADRWCRRPPRLVTFMSMIQLLEPSAGLCLQSFNMSDSHGIRL